MNTSILICIIIIIVCSIISYVLEPPVNKIGFKYIPKTFRLHKPKHHNSCYLQVRHLYIYYYICNIDGEYFLFYNLKLNAIKYPQQFLTLKDFDDPLIDKQNIITYYKNQ